ncbi:MAG: hypothetical protein IJW03_04245 [Clostridia bacterium]|nr:hypothetical protein [Clostridia bacterium]
MTLKDLQNDVYALGYEKPLEKSELFISALNQAMRIIYSEQKYQKSAKIRVRRAAEASRTPSFKYIGQPLTLPLVGRAYSMRVCGRGSVIINDGAAVREESFDGDGTLLRGFIRGAGTLTFSGDYSYDVCDLVTYSEIFSDSTDDIPDGSGTVSFDFSKFKDFLSFSDVARDERGAEIHEATLEGSYLTVRSNKSRDVYVKYNRAPTRLTLDDPSCEIDIPRSDEASLALLCASLLWRDDEPELSEHYHELYSELKSTRATSGGSKSAKYVLCDRWA